MDKRLTRLQVAGFVWTSLAGTLLHFLYDISGKNELVALFSAVNESIWEHMKLFFFPTVLFALMQNHFLGSEYKNFWCVKLIGTLLGLATIPIAYYTYTGIFGINVDWVNITIFFVAALVAYFAETRMFRKGNIPCNPIIAIIILWLVAVMFLVFTYTPPHILLFEDPVTKTYGIN